MESLNEDEDWGDPNHVNLNISDIESSFSKRDEDRDWSQKQPPEQGLLSILFGPFSKHSPGFANYSPSINFNQENLHVLNFWIKGIINKTFYFLINMNNIIPACLLPIPHSENIKCVRSSYWDNCPSLPRPLEPAVTATVCIEEMERRGHHKMSRSLTPGSSLLIVNGEDQSRCKMFLTNIPVMLSWGPRRRVMQRARAVTDHCWSLAWSDDGCQDIISPLSNQLGNSPGAEKSLFTVLHGSDRRSRSQSKVRMEK